MKTTRTIERGRNKGARVTVDHTNIALLRVVAFAIDRYNDRNAGVARDMASGQCFSGRVTMSPGLSWLLNEERAGYIDPNAEPRDDQGRNIIRYDDDAYIEGYTHNATLAEVALWALNLAADDDTDAGTSDQLQHVSERLEGELLGIQSALRKLRVKQARKAKRVKARKARSSKASKVAALKRDRAAAIAKAKRAGRPIIAGAIGEYA